MNFMLLLLFIFTFSYAHAQDLESISKAVGYNKLAKAIDSVPPPEERRRREAREFYARILKNMDSIPTRRDMCTPIPEMYQLHTWELWKLDICKDIDSVSAITIAVTAAITKYGVGVIPIAATVMGNNKEHWLIYLYNRKEPQCFDLIEAYNMGMLRFELLHIKMGIKTDHFGGKPDHTMRERCPFPICVLVSKKGGLVLYMERLPY